MKKNRCKKAVALILTLAISMSVLPSSFVAMAQPEIVAGGYEIDMEDIPQVHFAEHKEWEDLYQAAWNFHKINIRQVQQGLNPELTSGDKKSYYVDEAFDDTIFQWDTLFMMLFDKYGAHQFPTLNSMDNFYYHQVDSSGEDDGFISRRIAESNGQWTFTNYKDISGINPPLFAWAEWEQYRIHGDISRFTRIVKEKAVVDRIDSLYQFLKRTRTIKTGPLTGFYISNGQGNGLDNTPNQGGWNQSANDMTMQQVQSAEYIIKIANEIVAKDKTLSESDKEKYTALAEKYEQERITLTALIQDKMWSESGEFFFNAYVSDGSFTNIVTPTGLWSLAANVATSEQADAMINRYAMNSEKMFRPNGLSTVTYDFKGGWVGGFLPTGGYWNGAMWSPTSYQWLKGLQQYGYTDLAFEEAVRHVNALSNVYEQGYTDRNGVFQHTLWENYSSEYTKPGSTEFSDTQPSRINFVGWTGALAIASMLEDVVGIGINGPENEISWNINLTEEHGVSNLYYNNSDTGENRVTLSAAHRVSASSAAEITVTADKAFTLKVKLGEQTETKQIAAGTHTYTFAGTDGSEPYLGLAVRDFATADLNEETMAAAKDYVYFTSEKNNAIDDGLKYQQTKGTDLIYNVNSIGYYSDDARNPVTLRENDEFGALGLAGAQDCVKKSHVHGQEGFMMMAPATNEMGTIKAIVGVENATATIDAQLSDASAPMARSTVRGGAEEQVYVVEIPYRAASAGKDILVSYKIVSDTPGKTGKISLKGILLEDGGVEIPKAPENISLEAGNAKLSVDASAPEGEKYDSYKVYVGTDGTNFQAVYETSILPYSIPNISNYKRYYVAVSGIKGKAESQRSAVVSEVCEEQIRTDRERAYSDLETAIEAILNGNISFDEVTKGLNFDVTGAVYGSTFAFSSSTDGQKQGVFNDGSVVSPVKPERDIKLNLTIKVTSGDSTITVVQPVVVPAQDVNDLPYVSGAKTVTSGVVDLTTEGSKEWLQFNQATLTGYARKNIDPQIITDVAAIKGLSGRATDAVFTFTATDSGAVKPTNRTSILAKGLGNGYTFTLPASEKMQTAKIYANVWGGDVTLEIRVNGNLFYTDTFGKDDSSGMIGQCFEVDYKVPNEDDVVTAKLYCSKDLGLWGGCSVAFQAVTLAETDEQIPTPEVPPEMDETLMIRTGKAPSSANLTAEGAKDWVVFNNVDLDAVERKNAPEKTIANITAIQSATKLVPQPIDTTLSYTDGTITPSGSYRYGVVFEKLGNGITFDLPYAENAQSAKIYLGAWSAKVDVQADVIRDGGVVKSAVTSFDTGAQIGGTPAKFSMINLGYQLEDPQDTLRITIKSGQLYDTQWGNFSISAVTLSEDLSISVQPELTGGRIRIGRTQAAAGEIIDVFVLPDEGNQLEAGSLKYITADGKEFPITDNCFTMPNSSVTVAARFSGLGSNEVILPDVGNVSGNVDTVIRIPVSVGKFESKNEYKAVEIVASVPEELTLTGIAKNSNVNPENIEYQLGADGKLRVALMNTSGNPISMINSTGVQELFALEFKVNKQLTPGNTLTVSVDRLSAKGSEIQQDYDVTNGSSTITIESAGPEITAVSRELFIGDSSDVIPTSKKSVAVEFTGFDKDYAVSFGNIPFYYSSEISEKTSKTTYVAYVDSTVTLDSLNVVEDYTLAETKRDSILFGDADDNAKLDAQDALNALTVWLRKTVPTEKNILAVNVNADGCINTSDSIAIVDAYIDGDASPFPILSK